MFIFEIRVVIFGKKREKKLPTEEKQDRQDKAKSIGLETFGLQRVPALRTFWDLEKTMLHEISISGTVGVPF